MKRRDLIKHLKQHGCYADREGRNHEVWCNPANDKKSAISRQREINTVVGIAICKQLEVPIIKKK